MALGRPITLTDNVASKIVSTTATSGQTVFTVTGGYRINAISVYRNGVRLVDDSDFTAIDGVNVTLLSGATLGDVLEFQIFDDFRVADAILKNNSNQIIGGDITVTGTLSGASIGIQSSGSLIGAGKTLNFIGSGNTFRQVGDTIDVSIGATAINTGTTKVQTSTPGISNEVGGLGIGTFSGAGLNVTGVVTATSFTATESVDIAGGVSVTGISTFSSNVDINSDVDINRSLAVTGGATVTGLSTFTGNVDVNSDVDINRSLAVTGGATVSGFSTFTKFVDINESADISGGLNVAGITSAPTAVVTTLQASNIKANDGTTAMTITDSTGAVEFAQNLTIGGNMYVNGSTTQVNTSQTTIEDQLLELGMVDGSAPGSDLNKDIGVLFNYYTDAAKKAGVYWDDSTGRIVAASVVTESTGVLSASSYADFEVGGLFVSGCTGSATQIINCSSSTVILENITIDGGGF